MADYSFPSIICTGGIQAVAGSVLGMNYKNSELDFDNFINDAAYCLDAPESIPAGSVLYCDGFVAQRWAMRF